MEYKNTRQFMKGFIPFIVLFLSIHPAFSASRYWVSSSSSNWNSTSNWSATSGGSSGASVPGANDTAFFDGASGFNGNCSVDANVNVAGIVISGYTGTISQNAFTVTLGIKGYRQTSGVFTGSGSSFTINSTGVFTLTGGTFTASSGNFTITGSRGSSQTVFTHSSPGVFNHNNGTVIINPNQPGCSQLTYTLDVDASTNFYNLTQNATPSCGINAIVTSASGDVVSVTNNFTHSDGVFNGSLTFNGNLIVGSTADGGTGVIAATGSNAQTYAYTTGGRTAILRVNKSGNVFSAASGTTALFAQGFDLQAGTFDAPTGNLNVGGPWSASTTLFNHAGGTFNHNNGTVVFNPNQPGCTQLTFTADVIPSTVFGSVEINATPSCGINPIVTTPSGDQLVLAGSITHTDGIFNGNVSFDGDLIVASSSDGGTGIMTATGSGNQTYTVPAGVSRTFQLVVTKTSGTFAPASGTSNLYVQSFTLNSGTFTAPAGSFNIGGTWGVNAVLFSHTGGTFNHNNGSVVINPNQPGCTQLTFTVDVLPSTAFYNFEIKATPSCGINPIVTTGAGDVIACDADITHTDGIFNGNMSFAGNLSVAATADGGTGVMTANGSVNQSYTVPSGATRTFQLVVSKTGGILAPASGTTDLYVQGFTLNSGTFTAPSGNFNIGGTWSVNATLFNHTGGTFNHNGGTLILNPNQPGCTQLTFTVDVLSTTLFNNINFNATPSCGINPIITTAAGDVASGVGNLTHTDGIFNGMASFQGDLNIASTSDGGSGTITANGTGFQYYTYSLGAARTCKLVVDKTSGVLAPASGTTALSVQTFTLINGRFVAPSGIFNIGGTWATSQTLFNHIGGNFDHNFGTVLINPNQPGCTQLTFTLDVLPGIDFYNLDINATPSCGINPIVQTASGDVPNVVNNLTHTDGILNGQFTLKDSLIIASTSDGGTGVITVNSNLNQSYIFPSGGNRTCKIVVNKPAGTFGPDATTTSFSIQALAIQSGSFRAPSGNLNIGGTWTTNTTIFQQTGGNFIHNSGTVEMNPNQPGCTQLTFTIDVANNTVFNNLNLNATPSCGINAILTGGSGDTLDAAGTLTYTNGICNAAIEVAGNTTVTAGFDGGTGKLIFKGSNAQTFDLTGATGLFDGPVVVGKTSSAVTLNSVFTMDAAGQSLHLQGGNINTSSTNLLRVDRTVTVTGGSGSSFVNGPMLRMVAFNGSTSNLFFPIGKGGQYRQAFLNVTHNAATSFNYTAEVMNSSAQALAYTLPGTLDKVSPVRYWQIDRSATGNLTAASVQLFYGADDGVTNNTNLRIAQGTGGNWVNLGGSGSANGSGSITSSVNFTSFSPFTLANATGGTNFPGAALDFVGGNDYVSVAGGGGLNNLQEGTIEMWVKWSGTQDVGYSSSAYGAVLGRQSNGVFSNQVIALNGSNPASANIIWKPYVWGTNEITSSVVAGNNIWNHIAITYKSGEHKMYVNGTLVGSSAATGTINNSSSVPLTIGAWIDDGDCFSTSAIDEVRIWNRVLCQAEILNNMNCEIATSGSGLLANYHFNQGIGEGNNSTVTSLQDASGNSWTGTLTNIALSGTNSNWISTGAVASGISCAAYGPEINVKGNSVTISDGDVTPAAADHTSFGSVAVNASVTRTYTIENLGVSPITVSSISVTGSNPSMFVAGSLTPSGPIPASGTATIAVTFTPTSTGLKTATLTINSNDCDEAAYDFAIEGTGVVPGAALNMDGSNDYIDLGNPSQLNFTKTTPFSIETWAKFNTGATQDQQIVSKHGTTDPTGYGLQCTEGSGRMGKIEFYLLGQWSNASQNMWIRSNYASDIRDNTWHHIAATYDGSNNASGLHIYIDGVDYGSTQLQNSTIASGDITNSYNARIGGYWTYGGGPAEYLYGELDETRIWAKELCANEINAKRNCEIATTPNNLILNYHYNQGEASGNNTTVTTATDASAAAINGTLTNFTLTSSTSNWISPGAVTSGVSCGSFCDSNSTAPTAAGTYTSTNSYVSPTSGFRHFCDCQGNLLLSVKEGTSGVAIADNAVSLKITSTGSTFYPQHVGFVGNTFGYAAMDRTWDVAVTSQPTYQIPVRFYFNNSDFNSLNTTLVNNGLPGLYNVTNLSFWKVINMTKPAHAAVSSLTQWDVKVQMYSSVATDTTWLLGNRGGGLYYAQFLVSGFSGGGGGAGPLGLTPLPVDMLYVTAVPVNNSAIQVKWATAAEYNTDVFEIQRSENGRDFVTIGTTKAAGSSQYEQQYSFTDYKVLHNKLYYYRIKTVDMNKTANLSQTVTAKLSLSAPLSISVYPNPASDEVNVYLPEEAGLVKLTLFTMDGKAIHSQEGTSVRLAKIFTAGLPAGVYLLQVNADGALVNQRIIINK